MNVPSNAKPEIAIACSNPEILAMFKDEIPVVKSLVKASEVKIVVDGAELPEGYLKGFVSDEISSYVKVVGLIDIKLEIARINKRVKQVTDLMEKAIKKTKMPGYETKVPENVRSADKEKITNYENELAAVDKQMKVL